MRKKIKKSKKTMKKLLKKSVYNCIICIRGDTSQIIAF